MNELLATLSHVSAEIVAIFSAFILAITINNKEEFVKIINKLKHNELIAEQLKSHLARTDQTFFGRWIISKILNENKHLKEEITFDNFHKYSTISPAIINKCITKENFDYESRNEKYLLNKIPSIQDKFNIIETEIRQCDQNIISLIKEIIFDLDRFNKLRKRKKYLIIAFISNFLYYLLGVIYPLHFIPTDNLSISYTFDNFITNCKSDTGILLILFVGFYLTLVVFTMYFFFKTKVDEECIVNNTLMVEYSFFT